jgi:cytochrome P450
VSHDGKGHRVTTTEGTSEVADLAAKFDHWNPEQAVDPHGLYDELRAKCPIVHSEQNGGYYVAMRYDDVEEIAKNPTTFSSRYTSVPRAMFGDFNLLPPIQLDPPDHTAFRKLLVKPFTAPNVQRWEDEIRQECRRAIAGFIDKGSVDVVDRYAKYIPLRLMATMLGISATDEELFASWIHRILEVGAADPESLLAAAGEMQVYLSKAIADHRSAPRDDLMSLLIDSEVDGRRLSDEDLLGVVFLLILAGMDTTWGMISAAILYLSRRPEDRARLAADPALLPRAVEEFVRYFAPVLEGRFTTEDVEIRGVQIPKGESIMLCFASANRDPEAFPDADKVVIDREENRHFGFGVGVHRCLGAHLARLEVRVALEEWLAAIPEFSLEDEAGVRWGAGQLWSPRAVPVTFPAARRTGVGS